MKPGWKRRLLRERRSREPAQPVVTAIVPVPPPAPIVVTGPVDRSGAVGDAELVELWLKTGRRKRDSTRRAYKVDAARLRAFLDSRGKKLRTTDVTDLQAWADQLEGAASSRARRIAAVRSLFTFGQKIGYLVFNVGAVIEAPPIPNELAERILTEEEVWSMLRKASGRYALLVRFLYLTGARITEACDSRWKHVHPDVDGTATVTLHGKGGKTRHVRVVASLAAELAERRGDDDAPIFATKSGKSLHPTNASKLISKLAFAAGITRGASPHWLRHSYGSHALDRGATPATVKESLGHASLATTGKYLHAKPKDSAGLYLKV